MTRMRAALAVTAVAAAAAAGLAADAGAASAPGSGQHAALGSTTVSALAGSSARTAATPAASSGGTATPFQVCSKIPQGPQGTGPVEGPTAANEYADGYADASKLDGSEPVGPAYVAGNIWEEFDVMVGDTTYAVCSVAQVQPDDGGTPSFPPTTATFAAFGFAPVTATVQLTEVGLKAPPPITDVTYQQVSTPASGPTQPAETPFTSISTAQLLLRVLSVKVNGVTLDVGSHCQTATPLFTPDSPEDPDPATDPLVVMSGGDAPDDPLPVIEAPTSGGALAGTVTIPPFSGCGTGPDNLDPLLDASVSGPGNYVDLVTGELCEPVSDKTFCGSDGMADTEPLWSVSGGGTFSAAGRATLTWSTSIGKSNRITCTGSTVTGAMPDAAGPLRGALGTFTWTPTGCTGTGGTSWTVTEQGKASLSPSDQVTSSGTTTTFGTVTGLTLTMTDGTCTVTAAQPAAVLTFHYVQPPTPGFLLGGTITDTTVSSGCASLGFTWTGWNVITSFPLSPVSPGTITITSPTPAGTSS